MAWTAPTTRATGELITSSIWNTDLVNNLAYLKNAPTFDGLISSSLGANSIQRHIFTNTTSGTAAVMGIQIVGGATNSYLDSFSQGYTTSGVDIAGSTRLFADGAGGLLLVSLHASTGGVGFWTGSSPSKRWGVNFAGDWTFGASSHIADSNGTPSIASGFGTGGPTIVGTDYAFRVTEGSGLSTTGTVNFGHTWTTTPVCVVSNQGGGAGLNINLTPSTTQLVLSYNSSNLADFFVLCRGY